MENKNYDIFTQICSYENLELAFNRARKGKTLKPDIIKFGKSLEENLLQIQGELISHTYKPRLLETFIIKDPKTRKISKSDFRDRVIHHAVCNIIEPLFDKQFIYDSYANRIGKGTLKAIHRFDYFKRKVSKNNIRKCFVLKADIRHYFETVDQDVLVSIINRTIHDKKVLWLIKVILSNYNSIEQGKGMPLGNLTSQFFANVYLNELDQFVKHSLKAKHYIRYVDDFVILHNSKEHLEEYKKEIGGYLNANLNLQLHPDKSKVLSLEKGILFLGFRIFYYHKLIRKKNIRKFQGRLGELKMLYDDGSIMREDVISKFEGWLAYISNANTYQYRRRLIQKFSLLFPTEKNVAISNIKKQGYFIKKLEESKLQFTQQKTSQLFRKGLTIKEIALQRNIKESTVWNHIAGLIEHNQVRLLTVVPKEKIARILPRINSENDKLKDIKQRINDSLITFNEISCVLASIKSNNKKKNIIQLVKWYKEVNCLRKCFEDNNQRRICGRKFDCLIMQCPTLEMRKKEFLNLFNNHIKICILS